MTGLPAWARELTSLLLALVLSLAIAGLYIRIKRDTVVARALGATMALAGLVSSIVVLSIGDSVARGLGLVGAVALVRFRSNLRDPFDLVFMFASLAAGVAVGANAFFVGTAGTGVFLAAAWAVARRSPPVEALDTIDAIFTFRTRSGANGMPLVEDVLRRHARRHEMVRVRQVPGGREHAYHVLVASALGAHSALFEAVEQVPGVDDAQLVAYDAPEEVS